MTDTVDQIPEYPQTLSLADVDHANIPKPKTWTIEHFECWQREQVARENVRVLRRHIKKLRQSPEQAEKQEPVAWTNKENLLDLKTGACSHMYAKKEDDDDLPLYPAPPRIKFPVALRKMWTGQEVQQWLDEHVNGGNNA